MHRLLTLGCILTLGCASQPIAGPAAPIANAAPAGGTASVDAGPPPCTDLHAQIESSESQLASEAPTWLAAPDRMADDRRVRALRARADALGCPLPRS